MKRMRRGGKGARGQERSSTQEKRRGGREVGKHGVFDWSNGRLREIDNVATAGKT